MDIQVSLPLAFAAGLVSFLSPCVLPVVPSYLAFVSGLTLEELQAGGSAVRRRATVHSGLFVLGFSLVFMTLGLMSSSLGGPISRALPWLSRLGGVLLVALGLYLLGWLRVGALARERRFPVTGRRAGAWTALLVGMAFAAGWTPCIGPILASILLYASLETTMLEGTTLLAGYAAGLGVPFLAAALAMNAFLTGAPRARRLVAPLQKLAGAVLLIVGLLMVSGRFTSLSATLAGMGQLIDLEIP